MPIDPKCEHGEFCRCTFPGDGPEMVLVRREDLKYILDNCLDEGWRQGDWKVNNREYYEIFTRLTCATK